MDPSVSPDSPTRIEGRLRRVTVLFGLALSAMLLLLLGLAWITLARPDAPRLRTLSIVDNRGVERVRVAGIAALATPEVTSSDGQEAERG